MRSFLPSLFLAALASPALADITYIGDGQLPDFPQIWLANQTVRSICEAATAADVMWYWDQHGYAGLAKNGGVAATPWRDDAQSLVFTMAKYIYGKDPANGQHSNLGRGTTFAALGTYIRLKDMYAGQKTKGADGLVIDYYQAGNATYTNWTATLGAGNGAASVNLASLAWRPETGGPIALHSMASAGVDSEGKLLVVTHGWGDHPAENAPYKKPPYAQGETPYINQYPITVDNGRVAIPNPGDNSVELFAGPMFGAANRMTMGDFYAIHPKAKARVQMRNKQSVGFDFTYTSDIHNDTFEPIYQYIQEVETPISNVTAPPGWTAIPWSYLQTPDVTRLPISGAPSPFENDPPIDVTPVTLQGILFYTTTNPVLPGNNLDGFSFDSSQAFALQAEDAMSFLSDGRSFSVDAATTGLTTELLFPTMVPEPASLALFALGSLLLLRQRRIRKPADAPVPSHTPS
jgi:hypothetical protein